LKRNAFHPGAFGNDDHALDNTMLSTWAGIASEGMSFHPQIDYYETPTKGGTLSQSNSQAIQMQGKARGGGNEFAISTPIHRQLKQHLLHYLPEEGTDAQ
jgi:hypothetical protein